MCESEYGCQRPTTMPWNWSYRDCELTKTAFCYNRALFLLSHSSPAPLTLKPPPHHSTSLYSTESKLLATLPFLLPILPLSHDSRPCTFLSSFHPNDSRLMTYWPTFTFSSLVLLNSSTWAKWQASLIGSRFFVPLIWLLPVQKSVLESEQLTTPCNAP